MANNTIKFPVNKDIGIDELSPNRFQILISGEDGKVLIAVYAEDAETCDENADEIVEALNEYYHWADTL